MSNQNEQLIQNVSCSRCDSSQLYQFADGKGNTCKGGLEKFNISKRGGGLDAKNRWTDKNEKLFFPVKVMSAVFMKYYLKELKELWENKKLEYHGSAEYLQNHYAFKELLNKLYGMDWIVYTKKAFNGAESVINYLGRYTHRIAISNRRIVKIEGDKVIYMVKDYKNGGKMIPNTIAGTEFIRMFLMHVLPKLE